MRVRKKKNASERINVLNELLVQDITSFENIQKVSLEIGCGKGAFICELAKRNPHIDYIAIEKSESIIVIAMERAAKEGIKNIRFFCGDILSLEKIENLCFINEIYLNFSDPWPRTRHSKRRLTSERFLNVYKKILSKDGVIYMKTDNEQLFDFSLLSLVKNGFNTINVTRDLHKGDVRENIMTEYETFFVSKGMPIYALNAYIKET